ncbi:MAG: hypothetical protein K5768_08810 [Firmicutes bacterium]|nr:hypothetical protein [Bacillota bacterium]
MPIPETPGSRVENYLGVLIGQDNASLPETPQSRIEEYLAIIIQNLSGKSTVAFKNVRLNNGEKYYFKPGSVFLVDGPSTIHYGQYASGGTINEFSLDSNSYTIGFTTQLGKSESGDSEWNRLALYYTKDFTFENLVGGVDSIIGKVNAYTKDTTSNYIESKKNKLYVYLIEIS